MTQKRPWQEVVASKKKLQLQALSSFAGGPTDTEITNIPDARTLIAKITSGEVTCEAVLRSYITKASEAHSITNCLTEVLFEDALQRAKELDNYFNANGRPFGPLHGLPVTLKDQFDIEGWDTTLGYVGRAFQPATTDAALVAMLRSLGAVIIAKTNLPQSIMWGETDNPLFGLTTHHLNSSYTPGGSTGGESALLAYGGSILGWGTDIGGSIRGPAHMMGLYGLKPSNARLPYRGVPVSTDGQEHVPSAVGPLARTLDTVHLAVKSIIDLKPWEKDPRCVPIPWREEAYSDALARPLVVGVLADDGVVRPHPPISRVLQSTVDLLRSAGHHIVEWNAEFHPDCIAVQDAFYTADGGEDIRTAVAAGGEPLIPHVERLVNRDEAISVYNYWQLNRRKWELQQAYLDKWESIRCPATGRTVDVLLLPPMAHTAVPHGSCGWTGYTKVWNFLDYAACVVPGGCVQETDLKAPWDEYESRGPMDELCHNVWSRNKAEMAELRLPVGIQIVGRRLEEEKVLGAAKVVDDLLKGLHASALKNVRNNFGKKPLSSYLLILGMWCTGYPACRACTHAAVQCEQYRRPKKSDTIGALQQARQRIQWLEEEISIAFDIDCREISTGSSLKSIFETLPAVENQGPNTPSPQDAWTDGPHDVAADVRLEGAPDDTSPTANTDMSVLALNATGEMKYLGPSSGAFFATYAAAVARSLVPSQGGSHKRPYNIHHRNASSSVSRNSLSESRQSLSKEETQALLQSYKMWVHPLYPLLNPDFLDRLVVRCCDFEALNNGNHIGDSEMNSQMTIFYLVMALGATNYANTMRQSRAYYNHELEVSYSGLSPPFLYSKAMKYFDRVVQNLRTSVTVIQITLLISIYSSYGPIGSSQWQLAGLAMRMAIEIGLHHAPKLWQPSDLELDQKDRVFWTAYAIEISLAYNLGRPPSIGDEHITAKLPRYAEETALGIYHINHRQIQSRIVSQVYCGANRTGDVTDDEASCLIFKLQDDLNKWRDALPTFAQSSPYPRSYWERLYHGSSFVLHRSSPLCPRPSPSSLEKCIQSAGAYIDCILEVLRNSNVPLTWMLVQGVLFAGLTMLVTARTSFPLLQRHSGLSFLFVDLPGWTRKCSICLAIMNERWSEDLLQKLDTQFESLANDTLRMISSTLTTQQTERAVPADHATSSNQPSSVELSHQFTQPLVNDALHLNAGDLDYLETFREYLGIDGVQTFWDVFPSSLDAMDVNFLPLDANTIQDAGFIRRSEDVFQTW